MEAGGRNLCHLKCGNNENFISHLPKMSISLWKEPWTLSQNPSRGLIFLICKNGSILRHPHRASLCVATGAGGVYEELWAEISQRSGKVPVFE